MITRRNTLKLLGAMGGWLFAGGPPPAALAKVATDRRLVVVILRGGLDGLAAVPPYADPDYISQRGPLALKSPDGVLDLDGRFGLHPALSGLHKMYGLDEFTVFHAIATPYRSRSHFDGQDVLENGTVVPSGARNGWLNRVLALLGQPDRRLGLAVGQSVPLILRGEVPVGSWTPFQILPEASEDFLARLAQLYNGDPVLDPALEEAIRGLQLTEGETSDRRRRVRRGPEVLKTIAAGVGKLLADPDGPRIAVFEAGGWDTHAGQGTLNGRLARSLSSLDAGLTGLKQALRPDWGETVVLVASEFGRTVAANGTGGTDHGTASVAFLAGGAVNGGQVVTRWPGLASTNLYEGRDLAPTLDLRAVCKAVLLDHLGLPRDGLERVVFPNSDLAVPISELIRS